MAATVHIGKAPHAISSPHLRRENFDLPHNLMHVAAPTTSSVISQFPSARSDVIRTHHCTIQCRRHGVNFISHCPIYVTVQFQQAMRAPLLLLVAVALLALHFSLFHVCTGYPYSFNMRAPLLLLVAVALLALHFSLFHV
jgi:hypothetical protein